MVYLRDHYHIINAKLYRYLVGKNKGNNHKKLEV